jgi:hypothetical protein
VGQNASVATTKWYTLGRLSFGNIQVGRTPPVLLCRAQPTSLPLWPL